MIDLFSDIFTFRDTVLSRIDPRAKLLIAVAGLVAIIASARPAFPLVVFGCCLIGMIALRIPAKLIAVRLISPMGIVVVLVIVQSLFSGSTPLFSGAIGGWRFTATREGLDKGIMLGSRVLGAVSVMLLLSFATPAHKIFQALGWFRISKGWLEIAVLMYRYIFVLVDRATDLGAAQRLRLGYVGARRSLSSAGMLAGATILCSLDQAKNTHEAMMVRGYRGNLPFGPMPRMPRRDRLVTVGALVVLAAGYVLLGRRMI